MSDEITLTPVLKMWRPRVNRDHPVTGRLIQAIRRWHENKVDLLAACDAVDVEEHGTVVRVPDD